MCREGVSHLAIELYTIWIQVSSENPATMGSNPVVAREIGAGGVSNAKLMADMKPIPSTM